MFSRLFDYNSGARSKKLQIQNTHQSVSSRAPLYWREHCVECAAPLCYASCLLYKPRIDGKCERIVGGIRVGNHVDSVKMKVRRWAKLETRIPSTIILMNSGTYFFVSKILDFFTLCVKNIFGPKHYENFDGLIERLIYRFHSTFGTLMVHDMTLEGYMNVLSGDLQVVNFEVLTNGQLFLRRSQRLSLGMNSISFSMRPDGNRTYGKNLVIRLWFENDLESEFEMYNFNLIKSSSPLANLKSPLKCIAWDLDNTLWSGVIGDDGEENVILNEEIRYLIKLADEKGILQSIVSKNEFDLAFNHLKTLEISDYFLYPQINWRPKSENLNVLAGNLNIGVDSILVVDDSDFERREIKANVQKTNVLDVVDVKYLRVYLENLEAPKLENRRLQYVTENLRSIERANHESSGDLLIFLQNCEMKMDIFIPVIETDIHRCFELLQRSNQYNLHGKHLGNIEFQELLEREQCFALRVADKFGSYGIVGFLALKQQSESDHLLTNFVMSCRVAEKFVEVTALYHLIKYLNIATLRIEGVITQKNTPLRRVLSEIPFIKSVAVGEDTFNFQSQGVDEFKDNGVFQVNLL
jgi:FkbH-like protein